MAAKHDIQHGVTADLTVPRDDVLAACRRASEALGDSASLQSNASKITVTLTAPTLGGLVTGSKKRRAMGTIGIRLGNGNGAGVHLEAAIEKYVTSQSKVFGFVPAGPKSLQGRDRYFKFFDALENELRAVDPSGKIMRRRAQR